MVFENSWIKLSFWLIYFLRNVENLFFVGCLFWVF